MGMTLVETGIVLNGTARAAAQAKPMRALDRAKAFGKPITIPEFGARLCHVRSSPAGPSRRIGTGGLHSCRRDDAVLLRRVREGRVPHQQHGSQRQGRLGAQSEPQSRYG